jgi:hypothetical protein
MARRASVELPSHAPLALPTHRLPPCTPPARELSASFDFCSTRRKATTLTRTLARRTTAHDALTHEGAARWCWCQVQRLWHRLAKTEGTCSRLAAEKNQVTATLDQLWSEKEHLSAAVAAAAAAVAATDGYTSAAAPAGAQEGGAVVSPFLTATHTSPTALDEEMTVKVAALEERLKAAVQVGGGGRQHTYTHAQGKQAHRQGSDAYFIALFMISRYCPWKIPCRWLLRVSKAKSCAICVSSIPPSMTSLRQISALIMHADLSGEECAEERARDDNKCGVFFTR